MTESARAQRRRIQLALLGRAESATKRTRSQRARARGVRRRWSAAGLVQLLAGALVVLIGLSATSAIIARADISSSTARLGSRLQPATVAASTLWRGFTDQAAGHLGYLLTGAPNFLQRYSGGIRTAANAEADLRRLLAGDTSVTSLLDALDGAAQQWRTTAVDPQRTARQHGLIPTSTMLADITATSLLYDAVRTDLSAIGSHTQSLQAEQLRLIRSEQSRANLVTILTVVLTMLLAAVGVLVLRRAVLRPTWAMLRDIETVASGAHDHPISNSGPKECAAIADAVDHMRASILRYADDLAETKRQLAVAAEHERFAADLHDRTTQRLFGLGMHLTSTAAQHPELEPSMAPLIDETDDILRELRGVIFGLRRDETSSALAEDVARLVHESARSLGFTPSLTLNGPVDDVPDAIAVEVLSTLRESLTNVAKHADADHASVSVSVTDQALCLEVHDNGRGFAADVPSSGYGLANITARADNLNGTAWITSRPGEGTTVAWHVPCDLVATA